MSDTSWPDTARLLMEAAVAARHALASVLALRTGISDELLGDVLAILDESIRIASERS